MTPKRRNVTRNDVARLAGTSAAVVSYVVNNGPRPVSAATRSKVDQAIQQLGYRPNAVARSLRANSSSLLGLVFPDSANPFFAEMGRAVENAAYRHGYTVLLGNTDGDESREIRYADTLLRQQADGIIIISAGHSNSALQHIGDAGVPLILVDRKMPGFGVSTILVDNEDGGFQATRHLLDHGHTRIACVGGPASLSLASDRTHGWTRALREAGVRPNEQLLVQNEFTRYGGYAAARQLLQRTPPPTAIFASTDHQAIGVLKAVQEAGLDVPSDVAVVGFDGIQESLYTNPGLSTIKQPIQTVGDRAVSALMALIRGQPPTHELETLPVVLAPNRSCGCEEAKHLANTQPGTVGSPTTHA